MSSAIEAPDLDLSSTASVPDEAESGHGGGANDTLDFDLANVPDVVMLDAGEYQFKVDAAEKKTSKKDSAVQWLEFKLTCIDQPLAETLYHMMFLPRAADDQKAVARKLREMKQFVESTGNTPGQGFRAADYIGCTLRAEVKRGVRDGRDRQEIAKFLPPA